MTRPRCCYRIQFCPKATYFKPEEVPTTRLKVVELTTAEAEALRLKNLKGLDQTESAKEMRISQSSFQRILSSAYRKVSEAIVMGKSIKIVDQTNK